MLVASYTFSYEASVAIKKKERERKRNIFPRKERERVKGPEAHRRYHRLCTPAGRCACTEPLASNDERSADVRARPRSAISAASRLPSLPGHASRSACPNRATLVPNRQCERRAFSSLNTRRALVASGCRRPSRSLGRPCSDTFPRSGNREREKEKGKPLVRDERRSITDPSLFSSRVRAGRGQRSRHVYLHTHTRVVRTSMRHPLASAVRPRNFAVARRVQRIVSFISISY